MQISTYSPIILFILLVVGCSRANFVALTSNPEAVPICELANCGEGICKASSNALLGYECECYSGWKKLQMGPLTFRPCILPNCTLDFDCGSASPSPSPVAPFPTLNFSDPCSLTWCGSGSCMANGTDYTCKCDGGSTNLLNLTNLPCFRECYFGADCQELGFGPTLPDPPTTPSLVPPPSPALKPPPTPSSSDSSPPPIPSGSSAVLNHSSRIQQGVICLLLTATLLGRKEL